MNTYVVLRRNAWPSKTELEATTARSNDAAAEMAADVSCIRRYILAEETGSFGAVCVYRATSEDKVREHAACANLPAGDVILVGDVVLVNPDPCEPNTIIKETQP